MYALGPIPCCYKIHKPPTLPLRDTINKWPLYHLPTLDGGCWAFGYRSQKWTNIINIYIIILQLWLIKIWCLNWERITTKPVKVSRDKVVIYLRESIIVHFWPQSPFNDRLPMFECRWSNIQTLATISTKLPNFGCQCLNADGYKRGKVTCSLFGWCWCLNANIWTLPVQTSACLYASFKKVTLFLQCTLTTC